MDTKILYLEPFSKVHLAPICELVILYQPCSKGSELHQALHVSVIPWVSSELVQGLLSFAHMIMPVVTSLPVVAIVSSYSMSSFHEKTRTMNLSLYPVMFPYTA